MISAGNNDLNKCVAQPPLAGTDPVTMALNRCREVATKVHNAVCSGQPTCDVLSNVPSRATDSRMTAAGITPEEHADMRSAYTDGTIGPITVFANGNLIPAPEAAPTPSPAAAPAQPGAATPPPAAAGAAPAATAAAEVHVDSRGWRWGPSLTLHFGHAALNVNGVPTPSSSGTTSSSDPDCAINGVCGGIGYNEDPNTMGGLTHAERLGVRVLSGDAGFQLLLGGRFVHEYNITKNPADPNLSYIISPPSIQSYGLEAEVGFLNFFDGLYAGAGAVGGYRLFGLAGGDTTMLKTQMGGLREEQFKYSTWIVGGEGIFGAWLTDAKDWALDGSVIITTPLSKRAGQMQDAANAGGQPVYVQQGLSWGVGVSINYFLGGGEAQKGQNNASAQ